MKSRTSSQRALARIRLFDSKEVRRLMKVCRKNQAYFMIVTVHSMLMMLLSLA